MLNAQTFFLDNEKALDAITQSRNRIQAMSLIHQRLYQSENLALIDMDRYVPELIEYIKTAGTGSMAIVFKTAVDPIRSMWRRLYRSD